MKRVSLTRETILALNKLRHKNKQTKLRREREAAGEAINIERERSSTSEIMCVCQHQERRHFDSSYGPGRPCFACDCTDFEERDKYKNQAPAKKTAPKRSTAEEAVSAPFTSLGRRKIRL